MTDVKKQKVLAIVGPTASGKTALSIALAKRLNGEVVSFDSMQIYRGMDIGTAKPDVTERSGVPHHMFDVVSPNESFSCADYAQMARRVIADIHARGALPILVGGTGLYLESVLFTRSFESTPFDPAIRERLSALSPDVLWEQLCRVDPISAAQIHKNNVRRVIRALEIYEATGKTKAEQDAASRAEERYDSVLCGLDFVDRSVLSERIDRRVDRMVEAGLLEEVRAVAPLLSETARQAIGYKELLAYLDGSSTLTQAVETIKLRSRQYAKRQRTWFAHLSNVHWYYRDGNESSADFLKIVNFFENIFTNRA